MAKPCITSQIPDYAAALTSSMGLSWLLEHISLLGTQAGSCLSKQWQKRIDLALSQLKIFSFPFSSANADQPSDRLAHNCLHKTVLTKRAIKQGHSLPLFCPRWAELSVKRFCSRPAWPALTTAGTHGSLPVCPPFLSFKRNIDPLL